MDALQAVIEGLAWLVYWTVRVGAGLALVWFYLVLAAGVLGGSGSQR
jgi:hypothetical protein